MLRSFYQGGAEARPGLTSIDITKNLIESLEISARMWEFGF